MINNINRESLGKLQSGENIIIPYDICSYRGGICYFENEENDVYYGTKSEYIKKVEKNKSECTDENNFNAIFGIDKACFINKKNSPIDNVNNLLINIKNEKIFNDLRNRRKIYIPFEKCATENETCKLINRGRIYYGSNGNYVSKIVSGSIECNNKNFENDPNPGEKKNCYIDNRNILSVELI